MPSVERLRTKRRALVDQMNRIDGAIGVVDELIAEEAAAEEAAAIEAAKALFGPYRKPTGIDRSPATHWSSPVAPASPMAYAGSDPIDFMGHDRMLPTSVPEMLPVLPEEAPYLAPAEDVA